MRRRSDQTALKGAVGVGERLDMPLLEADVEVCGLGPAARLGYKVRAEIAAGDLTRRKSDARETKGLKTEAASGIEDMRTGRDTDALDAELLELLELLDLIEGFERGDVGAEVGGVRGGGESVEREAGHGRVSVFLEV